jgi:hypothetical protein
LAKYKNIMASSQERLQILKMIEEGKISASEGAELLRALDQSHRNATQEPLRGMSAPRWMRVRVTDTKTNTSKVSVNIPMGLVNIGMKMGARFIPNVEVEGEGLDQILEAVRKGEQGRVLDYRDPDSGEHIEVFLE